ncbi:exosortase A [bacterium]|nr:exosortase A [bacterium]
MFSRFIAEYKAAPQLTPLVIILLLIPVAFLSTTVSMVEIWLNNETFTHGFLILPISLWLIWGERERIAGIPLKQDARALFFLLPALALWILATLIDVAVIQQITMVAILPISVWLLLGYRLALALLFPLMYLFFAVPLGQSLIPPMMEFTADFTVYMVQLSGVPIFRDGLSFQLPSGNWSVVEECSGVRYLIASAALGTIYAYITYRSMPKRVFFIIASLIVPIVANGLRAYGIVMIGHLSGMQYAVGADHLLYGWVFFGVVIFVLFWIGGFWADSPQEVGDSGNTIEANGSQPILILSIAALTGTFLILNVGLTAIKTTKVDLPQSEMIVLPAIIGPWKQVPNYETQTTITAESVWSPQISNPDLMLATTYNGDRGRVTLHLGYFHAQRDGAEAVSSLNRLTNPYEGAWKLISSRRISDVGPGSITESQVSRGQRKRLVWSGYLIDGQVIANPYIAKILQAKSLLIGQRSASYLSLSTPFDAPLPQLQQRLANAWVSIETPLLEELARVSDTR